MPHCVGVQPHSILTALDGGRSRRVHLLGGLQTWTHSSEFIPESHFQSPPSSSSATTISSPMGQPRYSSSLTSVPSLCPPLPFVVGGFSSTSPAPSCGHLRGETRLGQVFLLHPPSAALLGPAWRVSFDETRAGWRQHPPRCDRPRRKRARPGRERTREPRARATTEGLPQNKISAASGRPLEKEAGYLVRQWAGR
jgi:hypothetical protein